MKDKMHYHFENNENFVLRCFTKKQYESCLKWCYDNGYLTDSEYNELTDIDVFDRFTHDDLLEQDFKNGGRCVHFNGSCYKGIDDYTTYMKVKECGKEPNLKFYLFVDEINEYGTIKSTINYYCSNCGAKQFNNQHNRCHWCKVKFIDTQEIKSSPNLK